MSVNVKTKFQIRYKSEIDLNLHLPNFDSAGDAWSSLSGMKSSQFYTVVKVTETIEEVPRPHIQPTLKEVFDAMVDGKDVTIEDSEGNMISGKVFRVGISADYAVIYFNSPDCWKTRFFHFMPRKES